MNEILKILENGHGLLFIIFLIMNTLDWVTGWAKARITKKESSSIGFCGVIKKISNWIIIFVSFVLSYAFTEFGTIVNIDMDTAKYLGWFVLISLTINEIRSIFENLVECNVKIPSILTKGLEVFNKKIEEVIEDDVD